MIALTPEVDAWLAALPNARRAAISHLRDVITNNLPDGFEEVCADMPSYVVPLALFPDGYHVSPRTPLPFAGFANQKHYVALYHFGLYVDPGLQKWFVEQYPRHSRQRLDMGKSCIRFRKPRDMPFELIAELMRQRSVADWVAAYSATRRAPSRRPLAQSARR